MKTKISVSVEQEVLAELERLLAAAPEFRSKSHWIELAIRRGLEMNKVEEQEAENGS